jgi:hypothetical protein
MKQLGDFPEGLIQGPNMGFVKIPIRAHREREEGRLTAFP